MTYRLLCWCSSLVHSLCCSTYDNYLYMYIYIKYKLYVSYVENNIFDLIFCSRCYIGPVKLEWYIGTLNILSMSTETAKHLKWISWYCIIMRIFALQYNSLRPSDAYVRQLTRPSLVHWRIYASRIYGVDQVTSHCLHNCWNSVELAIRNKRQLKK